MGAVIAPTMRNVADQPAIRSVAHGSMDCTQPRSSSFQKVPARTPIQPAMMPNTSGRPKAEMTGMLSKVRRGEPMRPAMVRPNAVKASSPGRSHGMISPPEGGGAGGGPDGVGVPEAYGGSGTVGGGSSMGGGSGEEGASAPRI